MVRLIVTICGLSFAVACAVAAGMLWVSGSVFARDGGQWAQLQTSPEERAWIVRQKQPDTLVSCCGDADLYYADRVAVEGAGDNQRVFAVITDDRDDASRNRPHRDIGTRVLIPTTKNNDARRDPNPSGHGVVFVSKDDKALCYFAPGGM